MFATENKLYIHNFQAYNLLQLSYFSIEKLTKVADGVEKKIDGSYSSVLQPPHLDPDVVELYQNITIVVNITVILTSLLAIYSVCQVLYDYTSCIRNM